MRKKTARASTLIPTLQSMGGISGGELHIKSGVLFDVDGVLVNTHHAHARAWLKVLEPLGIDIPSIRLYREEGRPSQDFFRTLLSEYNIIMSDEEILSVLEKKRSIYRSLAPVGMRDDALIAVTELKRLGWRIGLVSGSAHRNVVTALGDDVMKLFDCVITAGSYVHGKPDPEPYLNACRQLDLIPERSVAIENAPLGIISAKAAELRVIALTSTLPESELQDADDIVSDLTILPTLLGSPVNIVK